MLIQRICISLAYISGHKVLCLTALFMVSFYYLFTYRIYPCNNARPCIIHTPNFDQILRKKKNKILNRKVKLYNIKVFNEFGKPTEIMVTTSFIYLAVITILIQIQAHFCVIKYTLA